VRPFRGRTKKLIVAFHFHLFANQAGWKCDQCRRAGLEMRRRCAWLPAAAATPERVVWARKHVSTVTCPRSMITARSLAWLDEFLVRRNLSLKWPDDAGARDVEAFLLLQAEWETETQNG
jgi:hypothetical protein